MLDKDSTNCRIFVTIGLNDPERVFAHKIMVDIGAMPDCVLDGVLNLRRELCDELLLSGNFSDSIFVEDLYYLVYETKEAFELPFLYSDNSPYGQHLVANEQTKAMFRDALNSKGQAV